MDEARQVIARLQRIDELERRLLAEIRELVCEGERWTAAEGPGAEAASAMLDRCRTILGQQR